MKIIGIMGNPGSGKTTFSDAMGKKENVGVIHVDDIVAEAKRKYFRFFLQPKKENTTASTQNNPKLKANAKYFFYKNRLSFNLLMKIRSLLVVPKVKRMLEEFEQEGKDITVVDDWVLTSHKKLLDKFNHIYLLNRDFVGRRQGIRERDDLSRFEMKVADLPYSLEYVPIPEGSNVSRIINDGSIEDLEETAIWEYYKYVSPTFDEKYRVDSRKLETPKIHQQNLENNKLQLQSDAPNQAIVVEEDTK